MVKNPSWRAISFSMRRARQTDRSSPFSKPYRLARFELLEPRRVLSAPTLAAIADVTLEVGAPLHIALDGFDADGHALSYSVSSTSAELNAAVLEGNRSMKISVEDHGDMIFELFEGRAPLTTARIIELAESGFYDGLIFHRIIDEFMIQGGDPLGTGGGGSGIDFDDEFHHELQHTSSGILSMANSGDDTNDSQFFITDVPTRRLDYNHSVFGILNQGDDIREAISGVATTADKPDDDVVMSSVSIFVDEENGTLMISADELIEGGADVTVTVDDGNGGTTTQTFHVATEADSTDANPYLLPIADVYTTSDTPVTFTLEALDIEGDAVFFGGVVSPANDNLTMTVDNATGQVTVTPSNGIFGVHGIYVGVRATDASDWDTQFMPVMISPAVPTDIELLASSDTGASSSDGLTNLNNTADDTLRFRVNGVIEGAEVTLFADGVEIGQAVAGSDSVIIETNGTQELTDGTHTFTASQTLYDLDVNVGNRHDTVDLSSEVAAAMDIAVDTAAPQITSAPVVTATERHAYQYNVQTDDGNGGVGYQLTVAPAGMILNSANGQVTWTPQSQHGESVSVVVLATDAAGNMIEQAFDISVVQVDDAPVFSAYPAAQTVMPGGQVNLTFSATDPDPVNNDVTYSLEPGAPQDVAIDPTSGQLTWDVPAEHPDETVELTVRATEVVAEGEEAQSSTATFSVVVAEMPIEATLLTRFDAFRSGSVNPLAAASNLLAAFDRAISALTTSLDGISATSGGLTALPSTAHAVLSGELDSALGADTGLGRGSSRAGGDRALQSELDDPGFEPLGSGKSDGSESDKTGDEKDADSGPVRRTTYKLPEIMDAALRLLMQGEDKE